MHGALAIIESEREVITVRCIACFGDSLTEGFPFGSGNSWTAAVEKYSGIKMLNYGSCGACCDDIFYRLRYTCLPDYVKHVIFFGGANDVIEGRMLEHTLRDFESASAWAEDRGVKLCFVLPLLSGEEFLNTKLKLLRQHLAENFAEKNFLLDIQTGLLMKYSDLQTAYLDGVHPKADAYECMGAYAAPLLRKWLSEE